MPEEGFLRRWARMKATDQANGTDAAEEAPRLSSPPPSPPPVPAPPAAARWTRAGDTSPPAPPGPVEGCAVGGGKSSAVAGQPSPTLEDVAQLTPDSDYSIFIGQGVDKSVQRLALKKLFADPHFNVMDRLDMYMDDYNIPSPVSEEMLASLDHARSALRRFVEEPGDGDAITETPESARSAEPAESAEPPALQAPAPDVVEPEAIHRDDAAHDHGQFHSPNQQLPQGQA